MENKKNIPETQKEEGKEIESDETPEEKDSKKKLGFF
jgi:hypothetical protein